MKKIYLLMLIAIVALSSCKKKEKDEGFLLDTPYFAYYEVQWMEGYPYVDWIKTTIANPTNEQIYCISGKLSITINNQELYSCYLQFGSKTDKTLMVIPARTMRESNMVYNSLIPVSVCKAEYEWSFSDVNYMTLEGDSPKTMPTQRVNVKFNRVKQLVQISGD